MSNYHIVGNLMSRLICRHTTSFKAAESVTFDLLILKIMFLFFKNTVKYSNSGKHFTIFVNLNKLSLSKQLHLC